MGKPLGVRVSLWAHMARKKRTSFYISFKTAVKACVALILLGFVWMSAGRQQDAAYRKLLGDERIEVQQNTVPPDVLQWMSEGGELGANIKGTREISALPKMIRVPILMYHYVEYVKNKGDTIRQSLSLSPYTFEEEVKTLVDAGYTFLTNAELADTLSGIVPLPAKPIVLTFDDGYRDFYTDVFPILKKYHIKATVYIISGFLGYPNNMDGWQVRELANGGLVEIGAHTVHHAWLKGMQQKELVYEVYRSKKTLEELTGKPVVSFAYPYGVFDVSAIRELADAGYTSAVSTIPGADQYQTHRYFLYRLRPGGKTGESLLTWLEHVKNEQVSYVVK